MGLDVLFGWLLDKLERASVMSWVYPWQRAVRVCGKCYEEVGPGFHWKLPWMMEFNDDDVTWRKLECPQQRVISCDNTTWFITLVMELRIKDIVRAHVKVSDYEDSVITDAQAVVARWINSTGDAGVSIEGLEADCTEDIQRSAERWGCEARNIGASNLAPFDKVYCVVGAEEDLLIE